MNSMSAGMRMSADFLLESKLVDENHFHIARSGVEFLNALVIRRLSVGKIGQALAMNDGPVVMLFHPSDVVAAPRRELRC